MGTAGRCGNGIIISNNSLIMVKQFKFKIFKGSSEAAYAFSSVIEAVTSPCGSQKTGMRKLDQWAGRVHYFS